MFNENYWSESRELYKKLLKTEKSGVVDLLKMMINDEAITQKLIIEISNEYEREEV